jgi:hypothetical protein
MVRALLMTAALAVGVAPAVAQADPSCSGHITTSEVEPMASPAIVWFTTPVSSTANPKMSAKFLDGLRGAGVTIADQGNTLLNIAISVEPPAGGGQGPTPGTYSDFSWVSGEGLAAAGTTTIQGAVLSLSAQAMNTANQGLAWVGTINCTIMTNDPAALAQSLGAGIGRMLGKTTDRRPY